MTNPLTILNKQKAKNKIYPSEISKAYYEKKYTPNQIAMELNTYFKGSVLTTDEINQVLLDVKKQHKEVENSSVDLKQKQYYAITSLVSSTITKETAKENKSNKAKWLPSGSVNPSLAHIENYGEIFDLDEGIGGELPAQRPNCQCGFSIIKE